jgi:phosphatidylserine decarboxylase
METLRQIGSVESVGSKGLRNVLSVLLGVWWWYQAHRRLASSVTTTTPEVPTVPKGSNRLVLIAPEGWPFIALFVAATALGGWAGVHWLGAWGWLIVFAGSVLSIWCVAFFRDPNRTGSILPHAVLSPADGVVCVVDEAAPPPDLGMGSATMPRVCVFMNVFNVHVNRAPVAGRVRKIAYHQGQFLNASFDKASSVNERSSMALEMADGRLVIAVQIAGLVARRIVSRVKEGDVLSKGDRYGLIRFGSRVDVYLPPGSTIGVRVGQKVSAGATTIASLVPADLNAPATRAQSAVVEV